MSDEVRKTIQAAIERAQAAGDADKVARLQVAERYLFDAQFRAAREEVSWNSLQPVTAA